MPSFDEITSLSQFGDELQRQNLIRRIKEKNEEPETIPQYGMLTAPGFYVSGDLYAAYLVLKEMFDDEA